MQTFSQAWCQSIREILSTGELVSPRGELTREILQRTMAVDMRYPVLTIPNRQLNYKFMAAEAFWILSGDDRVSTISPYNKRIANFSDDGERFFGAYGPKILDQLPYIITKLRHDNDSRQAGLTIWRENPPETKDVPCTVAIFFSIRNERVNAHVFMRSSDVWLGVPYDVFNFSMLAHLVCGHLNLNRTYNLFTPGILYLTAASSHLYEINWSDAMRCTNSSILEQGRTPEILSTNVEFLMECLKELRDTKPGDSRRWWEIK